MGRPCPYHGIAISADCVDCDDKPCRNVNKHKYKTVVIGLDQSYANTGITLAADNKLLKITSKRLDKYQTNTERRYHLKLTLIKILKALENKADNIVCVIERIRLSSQGFINIDYIKSIGALNALIVDIMSEHNIEVYSVDTRCWKAQVVGTSKPTPNNYGVPDEKWPTVRWLLNQGWENSILEEVTGRKTKGTFIRNGKKYMYNNDAADSAGIALFWFRGEPSKLNLEK